MILLGLIDFTDLAKNMNEMLLVKDQIIGAEKDLKGTRERS
jgi:hypothetical protein